MVEYAVSKGLISGYEDGSFRPNEFITRSEFSRLSVKLLDLLSEKDWFNGPKQDETIPRKENLKQMFPKYFK